ncbi:MAG: enoyl-CoA hydratase/isomerase family protein [Paracoccaceae bacterium]|nr:enoyl-CoA hydratase/isomerase family protein [Paracoccaceae bacterium]MDG2257381.1 enoyl-CoA hydratase/isomerase family protein [Paracoccaceae bacterium]
MSEGVSFHLENDVVWLGLSEGGAKILSAAFAKSLGDALQRAIATPDVKCIVLSGAPKGFPRGNLNTDRPELDETVAISNILDQIEACQIPVVAIVPDAAINEGLELALAAHYRIAAKSARFGYNHISTGLMPALGGSQRLPRLAGAKFALEVLLNGKIFTASQAFDAGMIDLVTEIDFATETTSFIKNLVEKELGPRPTGSIVGGQSDSVRYQAQMNEAKKLVESLKFQQLQRLLIVLRRRRSHR